jgi:DNA-binding MarR family transcriptional regulator
MRYKIRLHCDLFKCGSPQVARRPGVGQDEPHARPPVAARFSHFRYALRRFLRFSEKEARSAGVTPQQHQLLLGIAGFSESGVATISQLAEFLQERNNSVVGLVERAAKSGLVRRRNSAADQRQVLVSLTPRGRGILIRLSRLHREEVDRVRAVIVSSAEALEKTPKAAGLKTRSRKPTQSPPPPPSSLKHHREMTS